MFTLSEIEIIMQKRRGEMMTLLRELGLGGVGQNWQEEFDSFLTDKVCRLMKSDSVFEGYSFLLRAADIPQSYSETEKEKLAKIAANRPEIERRIIKRTVPLSPQYERHFTVRNTGSNPLTYLLKNIKGLFNRLEVVATDLHCMEKVQKNGEFIAKVENIRREIKGLEERIQRLDGLYIVTTSAPSDLLTENEFISFIGQSKGGDKFLVSVSMDKVEPKPASPQYMKFTEDEARYMLDVLEKLNDIVNGK